jgi:hypothetical protein
MLFPSAVGQPDALLGFPSGQVGRQLAEMVRDPLSSTGSLSGFSRHRSGAASASASALAPLLPPRSWNDAFNRAALELIALTATTTAAGRADRVSAAATDMGAHGGGVSALQKIERAAIAAATPVSYSPQVSSYGRASAVDQDELPPSIRTSFRRRSSS